ncbi:MAG: TRAP transporter large permease subunit, partial [Vulcanimicrobiaceae bacterium]
VAPFAIIGLLVLMYLVLGFFMEQIAILTLTIPIVVPVVVSLGFSPIWFGVVQTMTAEIGLAHPPLGLNIYVVASAADASPEEVISGIWWPLGALLLCLLVILLVPQLSLFLPEHMLHIRNG